MLSGPKRPGHPRLLQWDGRRNSTRHDPWMLWGLFRRAVLIRLAAVQATALLVAALVFWSGPSMPYRLGEVPPRDLRVRVYFEVVNQPHTEWVREEEALRHPQQRDPVTAELLPPPVPPVIERYPPGLPLAKRGSPINEAQLNLLEEEHRAWVGSQRTNMRVRRALSLSLIVSLLAFVLAMYVGRFHPNLAASMPKVLAVCVLVLITQVAAELLRGPPWHAVLIPLAAAAMICSIAYNAPFALLMAFVLSLVACLSSSADIGYLLILMSGAAPAVLLLRRVHTRTRLIEVTAGAGLICALMTVGVGALEGQTWQFILADAGRHFAWCLLAGFLLSGALPVIERSFGVVTEVSLQELSDGSHPLLQELVRRAPGTYTHSITVATLAEPAAEAIGANPLLVRVGSYFHDIGKMLKPQYFVENQSGVNLHDDLEPGLSALVIFGHVKDGLALANDYSLPKPIVDIIQQHHGTTLVEFFFRKAVKSQGANGQSAESLESSFRYVGPKPQSREAGIIMLADAVESTSRTLTMPTPSSCRKLVHDLMMKRLLDGQFEESGLTLSDLFVMEECLAKSLMALFHARIRYPDDELKRA